MFVKQIDPRGTMGAEQMDTIMSKLRNADEASVVVINVAGDALTIGVDWNEFANDWEFVHQMVRGRGLSL